MKIHFMVQNNHKHKKLQIYINNKILHHHIPQRQLTLVTTLQKINSLQLPDPTDYPPENFPTTHRE